MQQVDQINLTREVNMKLTEKQIINILDNKLIDTCNEEEKKQVFNFAFGDEFMKSKDKGILKELGFYEVKI